MQSNIDNISQFGYTFQTKLVYTLLTDHKFLERIGDALHVKYFENEAFSWIVQTIREHYKRYKNSPSIEAIAIYVKEMQNASLKETVKNAIRDIFKDTTDLDFIKNKTIEFCQQQALKTAIYDSVTLYQDGKRLEVRKVIDDALKVGIDSDIGHDYTVSFSQRIDQTSRKTVSTGWNVINSITDGGLGPGELGIIVGAAGMGKSWALISMAATAIKNGLSVVYYTLELSEHYVGIRFDSHLLGIAGENIKFHQDEVLSKLETIPGTLLIKYYPTKAATVQTIKSHIEKMKVIKGTPPDIVFVDYADLLNGPGKEKRHVLESIYEDLRGVAGEFNIPVWTASQANRSSVESDIIEGDKVSEAYSKVMIGDFILSVSRKMSDKISGTARWHVIKNRFGKDGITFPSNFNATVGHIDILEESSSSGKEALHKMENDNEVIRKLIKRKYNELESGKFE